MKVTFNVKGNRLACFERHVIPVPEAGCWLWTGSVEKGGYGVFHLNGRSNPGVGAHRASWELYRGKIPASLNVLHRCDVRCCVNPNHLFLGTHADNTNDMIAKGRGIYPGAPGTVNGRAKVTDVSVIAIRTRGLAGESRTKLAAEFGVARTSISGIIHGKTWAHLQNRGGEF